MEDAKAQKTCANCDRPIGKLEPEKRFRGELVCGDCFAKLTSSTTPAHSEFRALGLSSRKVAWGIALVGMFGAVFIWGIPLIIWGIVADYMIAKHQKMTRQSKETDAIRSRVKSMNMD